MVTPSLQFGICFLLALVAPACSSHYYAFINDCSPNPCKNGGTCTDGSMSFTCSCVTGYTGNLCETNINDCQANSCSNAGGCVDGVNGFTCVCATGCTGATCDTCATAPDTSGCNNGGTNVDGTCFCAAGFEGSMCEVVSCGEAPCYPYATRNATGTAVASTATFTCPSDFTQCVNPAVVTCQSTGMWTSLENVCDRSYYSGNLYRGKLYPTPCRPSTYLRLTFTVYIYGTPSSFAIRSGNNVLFMVKFVRINYYWYTYFYTYVNGRWYYVWYYGVPFYLNTPTDMSITFQNGQYTFSSLGYSVTRPEPIAGATPTAFFFSDYMYLRNLRMDPTP